MPEALLTVLTGIAWPAAIAIAWVAGEAGYRWLSLPRISSYGVAGFAMAASQGGFLNNPSGGPVALLADFAFALILFELGYRINLRWLRTNPWPGVTSVVEAAGSFAAVFILARALAVPLVPSLLLSAMAMSTSPAAVLRVANEL
ncbi:MAG: cation:proton antiporter, partial [Pseudomonadota bacterium]